MPLSVPKNFFAGSRPIALVAGGVGFIGSFVCEKLLEKGVKVICLDNWQTGLKENISALKSNQNFFLLQADITKKAIKGIERVDYILHLAGLEAFLNGEDVSIETLDANSLGTRNLLELAQKQSSRFLLGSSIYVFAKYPAGRSTKDYFGKTREGEGEYSHLEAKRFAEALVAEFAQKRGIDCRIVRIGDVYGPRMLLTTGSAIARFFKAALYRESIPLAKEVVYPVFVEDVVEGIIKAVLSSGTKDSIISLAGEKEKLESFAQRVSQISGLPLKKEEGQQGEEREVAEGVARAGRDLVAWRAVTSSSEGIRKTLDYFEQNKTHQVQGTEKRLSVPEEHRLTQNLFQTLGITHLQDFSKKEKIEKGKEGYFWDLSNQQRNVKSSSSTNLSVERKTWHIALIVLLGFVFWFFVLPIGEFVLGLISLSWAKVGIREGNTVSATRWAASSVFLFGSSKMGFERWLTFPGLKNESVIFKKKSGILEEVANLVSEGISITEKGRGLAKGVLGKDPFPLASISQQLAVDLASFDHRAAFLETELRGEDLSLSLPIIGRKTLLVKDQLKDVRKYSDTLSRIILYTTDALGSDKRKTYLVLFQNNTELRPTGGFIGSFGLFSFEKGHLAGFDVQDVYSADGELKGHVDPPLALSQHLGESNWYLRDSNWSPDFPTSAQRASWFLDKELAIGVDGVVALDLEFIKSLLRGVGEVNLADFGESVNSDNLYQKVQIQAEGNFFPGSHAKKDYLTAIARATIQKLTDSPQSVAILAGTLVKSLEERHVAVWTQEDRLNQVLRINGWDGAIRNVACIGPDTSKKQPGCVADYLGVFEANLGVNKSNYFLERSSSLDILVTSGKIEHILTINYRNTSESGVWPGGDYKNYLRVYTPQGSKIISATLSDPQGTSQEQLQTDESSEKGKEVFGMLSLVPAGAARELKIAWETPAQNLVPEKGELLFLWQKQPGTQADSTSVRASLPTGNYKISANPSPSLTGSGQVSYNTTLSRDLLLDIAWQAKNTY